MRSTFLRGIRISLALVAFVLATGTISSVVEESIPSVSTAITVNADGRQLQSFQNIVDIVSSSAILTTFKDYAEKAGLVETLRQTEDITVLIPTDAAFDRFAQVVPPGLIEKLNSPEYKFHLQNFLLYHVILGEYPSSAISTGTVVSSFFGDGIEFTVNSGGIYINYSEDTVNGETIIFGSLVTKPDIVASNGIIHNIDLPLAPYWIGFDTVMVIETLEYHSTLFSLLGDAGLIESLVGEGPFTVFAPTNNALEQYDGSVDLETLLLYHVVPGIYMAQEIDEIIGNLGTLTTLQGEDIALGIGFGSNEATATVNGDVFLPVALDLLANNGVVHSIDQVLIPPSSAPSDEGTIFDVAVADSDTFSSFVSYIEAADLVSFLTALSGVTVFAPNNDAFDTLADENPELVQKLLTEDYLVHLMDLLRYHIIPALVPSQQFEDFVSSESFNQEFLAFSIDGDGDIIINDTSQVVVPDIKAANGIMHGINEVLRPSWVGKNIMDRVPENPELSALASAIEKADLVAALAEDGPFTVFAPTNAAFEEFLNGASLDSVDFDTLTKVLTRHVVPGNFAEEVAGGDVTLTTISGETLSANFGSFTVGNANIEVGALAENGIIWVIDKVLPDPADEAEVPTVAPVDPDLTPTAAPRNGFGNLILGPTPAVFNSPGDSLPTPAVLQYIAQNMRRPTRGNRLDGL